MRELIDRQAAIDALKRKQDDGKGDLSRFYNTIIQHDIEAIMALPSAHGTNLAEAGTDCITRQAAINKILGQPPEPHYPSWYAEQIKELPPAHPDTYWKEQCQSYEQTINKLRESLSTQPEIIRCCECKYLQCNMRLDGYLPKGVDEFECRHWCGSCDPMDFCSYAERRTE